MKILRWVLRIIATFFVLFLLLLGISFLVAELATPLEHDEPQPPHRGERRVAAIARR
jgi:hypothetical protein